MKNSKLRRALMLVACAVLLVSLSVGATLAYLTSTTGVVTNTFTVGSVNITLDETDVDLYGVKDSDTRVTANTYKLLPGHNYIKDPIVHVTSGSEVSWLFVKVVNEIADIEAETTIKNQMLTNGWIQLVLTNEDGTTTTVENVWYYETTVDARTKAVDVTVFEEFTIIDEIANDTLATYADKTITVQAYAVQADGFDSAVAAWTAAPCTWGETTTAAE